MAKAVSEFVCQSCGHRAPKWMGKCSECGGWNTLAEEIVKSASRNRASREAPSKSSRGVFSLSELSPTSQQRILTGVDEFDRILGGGLVPGSLTLIGGDPGIGKSTLVLQSMFKVADQGARVLYVSGEESPEQIRLRASRLGDCPETLRVCPEICIEDILNLIEIEKPEVLVLDSIQTFYTSDLPSAPGSVGQVREVAFKVFQVCKALSLPVLVIGHITKDGGLAGPKSLEHIVDSVLYFEGDRGHAYRILRVVKNRFGPTPEMGVFEMRSDGLHPVDNPSEIFLAERPEEASGSVIVATLEGSRPLLVEVQALVSPSSSIGMPRRMAAGVDQNRMVLLVAIMEKRLELHLQGEDIFVNIAGGLKLTEPAVDLGVATAIAGSFRNRVIDPKTVMIGEVGLTGEVRAVTQLEPRIQEASKLGFTRCVVPHTIKKSPAMDIKGMEFVYVKHLEETFDHVFK